MEKDKVYISGAIAHYNIDERKGAFLDAENRLRAMGFNPVNPFKNGLPDEAHWSCLLYTSPSPRDRG